MRATHAARAHANERERERHVAEFVCHTRPLPLRRKRKEKRINMSAAAAATATQVVAAMQSRVSHPSVCGARNARYSTPLALENLSLTSACVLSYRLSAASARSRRPRATQDRGRRLRAAQVREERARARMRCTSLTPSIDNGQTRCLIDVLRPTHTHTRGLCKSRIISIASAEVSCVSRDRQLAQRDDN